MGDCYCNAPAFRASDLMEEQKAYHNDHCGKSDDIYKVSHIAVL